jgi:hypothetical protein
LYNSSNSILSSIFPPLHNKIFPERKILYLYYNETPSQTHIVRRGIVGVINLACTETSIVSVVVVVVGRGRPIKFSQTSSKHFYCSTFDNTTYMVEQSLSLY